jgi:outer membrane immunogenic protein
MRKFAFKALIVAALSLGAAGYAAAADMPTKAPAMAPPFGYSWTGIYLGINGGYGWGRSEQFLLGSTATTQPYNIEGGLVGGTLGVNWQVTNWVLGVEMDADWANISKTILAPGICASAVCFTEVRSLTTVRPRLGYAWDRWMVYVTGGLALATLKAGQDSCAPRLCGTVNMADGWTAGGGVEAFVMPKLSAKIEYLHVDIGERAIYSPGTPVHSYARMDIVRGGLNYHF